MYSGIHIFNDLGGGVEEIYYNIFLFLNFVSIRAFNSFIAIYLFRLEIYFCYPVFHVLEKKKKTNNYKMESEH